jgi:hypothetical protein
LAKEKVGKTIQKDDFPYFNSLDESSFEQISSSDVSTYGEHFVQRIEEHKKRAQAIFKLYKKKECERRRRYKRKEKENKSKPKHATNLLLNRCGICGRLRMGVNLFWGVVLCDLCYFTPSRILFVMNRRYVDVEAIDYPMPKDGFSEEIAMEKASDPELTKEADIPQQVIEEDVILDSLHCDEWMDLEFTKEELDEIEKEYPNFNKEN